MELTIVSRSGQKKIDIAWIELNTPTGNYVIQEGHVPTILRLSEHKDVIFSLSSGAIETIKPVTAFAHITREKVVLLVSE